MWVIDLLKAGYHWAHDHWATISSVLSGGVLLGIWGWFKTWRTEKKRAASLVYMYSEECVGMYERFAQYVNQIYLERKYSLSRPFSFLPSSELARLVELDVSRETLSAIYVIHERNNLVTLQVDRAQQFMQEMYYPATFGDRKVYVLPSQREFDRIKDFVESEYESLIKAMDTLVADCSKRCGKKATAELREKYEKAKTKIKNAQEKKDPNGTFKGERPDLGGGTAPILGVPIPM